MASRLHGSRSGEDRGSAGLIYGLYLLGLINGLTILIGFGAALLNLRGAGHTMKSHHLLQIRTVWIAAIWLLAGGGLILAGARFAPGPVAAALTLAGWLVCGSTWLWFAVRSMAGLLYLLRNQPYPRPRSWLI